MTRIRSGWYSFEVPASEVFRRKRYNRMSGSHSTNKDVVLKWAENRRNLGHPTIVKTFIGYSIRNRNKKSKLYVLYGRKK